MKTKTNILFATIVLTCAMFFSCCKPDNYDPCAGSPSQTFNYNISDSNKCKIPYTGFDTLVFISDLGDTAILFGQGKQDYPTVVTANSTINPDCSNLNYYKYENIDFLYTGINGKLYSLLYKLYDDNPFNLIKIKINNYQICSNSFTNANNSNFYTDSVYIKGIFYKGINLDISNKVLYNYKFGILRFIDINQLIWIRSF